MDKEKIPSFFGSKEFIEEISKMKSDEQQSTAKDKPMTNEEASVGTKGAQPKPRKRLTPEQVARMIKEWDEKSISEWAKELDVSYQTISKMAEIVRKDDASLCPKKDVVKVKREDIAKTAIALYKKEQGKK